MPRPATPSSLDTPLVIGLAGGTASGKSWLARHVADHLGPDRCLVLAQDRYYRSRPGLGPAARARLNFDLPSAFDTPLLLRHLGDLRAGRPVSVPRYDYTAHARAPAGDAVAPRPIILLEGLFVLAIPRLRAALDLSVFVDCPADLRLARRLGRDVAERGRDLAEVLDRYLRHARPGHERHIQPSRTHAHLVWDQTTDKTFPARLVRRLRAARPIGLPCPSTSVPPPFSHPPA